VIAASVLGALVLTVTGPDTWSELIDDADLLWPPHPELVPALEAWLERAATRERAEPSASIEDANLARSVARLTEPSGIGPEHGWSVPRRLAFARRLAAARTAGSDAAHWAARWRAALPALRAEHPDVAIDAWPGLVPIGRDPSSGRFEFWHVQTGTEPTRARDGRLQLEPENGLVLVLLPGGETLLGAQAEDPDGPHFDPLARPNETVRRVTLSPFLISKFELTQAQWKGLFGTNPSYYGPDGLYDPSWNPTGAPPSGLEPLEGASWRECQRAAFVCGLQLPTEAQWEYAARAGTTTPWWTGAERDSLAGAANLIDESARGAGADFRTLAEWPGFDDGWAVHAPVGTFAPNPFGLHEVAGNVFEYCRDGFGSLDGRPAHDPVAPIDGRARRVVRGGSWHYPASLARSSYRGSKPPDRDARGRTSNNIGLRPALELAPR